MTEKGVVVDGGGSGAWRPDRARLRDASRAALAPVVACAVALCGLGAWTASGAAGSPATLEVTTAWMFLPRGDAGSTAAYFRISNSGDSADRLTAVTSPVADSATLYRTTESGAALAAVQATVPANGTLAMAPRGTEVTLTARDAGAAWAALKEGDRVPFVLHFRDSGRVETSAVVVRPGAF